MDVLHRPQGCVPPYSYSSSFKEIPEVQLPRQGLSVSMSPIRSVSGPLAFHQGGHRSQIHGSFPGNSTTSIPGRLALQSPVSRRMSTSRSSCDQVGPGTGMDLEFRQIRPYSETDFQFYRNQVQPGGLYRVPNSREFDQTSQSSVFDEVRPDVHRQRMATDHWGSGLPRTFGQVRSLPHEALPLASVEPLECSPRSSGRTDSSLRGYYERSELVDEHRYIHGRTSGSSSSQHQDIHGRMYHRMGGSRGREHHQGSLGSRRETSSHQCSGDEGSSVCSPEFRSETKSPGSCINRQYVSSSIHKPTGGNQVSVSLERNSSAVSVSTRLEDVPSSSTHSRTSERDSRHVVEGRADSPHGVVLEQDSHQRVVSRVGVSNDRSLCDTVQSQVSCVCFPSTGLSSVRNRCTVHGLEQSVGVRLPSSTDNDQSHTEDQNVILQDHSYSVSLAKPTVLPGSSGTVCSSSVQAASDSRSTEPVSVRSVSPTAGPSQASRLDSEHRALAARGFSKEAASRISAPQAESTLGIYQGKWRVFSSWCEGRNEDPFQASAPLIADFLLHLFKDLGRKPSTIAGYRTAIAGALKTSLGVDYGKDQQLSALILSFFREQPNSVRSFPSWDLSLVLKVLLKPPFEPLQLAELKYVTWKTIFLVLLASGSRRGEIHSLDHSKVRPSLNWSAVTLEPHASFVSKTQIRTSGASCFSAIRIPALGPLLEPGMEEDRGLCPVRAIKVYLDRTKELREGKKLLFVSYKSGHKGDIHKNTVSSWVRKLLHFSYSSAPEDVVKLTSARTHEVRALASSMAFRGSMELEEVLKACSWKSANTFTTHYLRDVSVFSEDLHSLGPLVAAQRVVHPPSGSAKF